MGFSQRVIFLLRTPGDSTWGHIILWNSSGFLIPYTQTEVLISDEILEGLCECTDSWCDVIAKKGIQNPFIFQPNPCRVFPPARVREDVLLYRFITRQRCRSTGSAFCSEMFIIITNDIVGIPSGELINNKLGIIKETCQNFWNRFLWLCSSSSLDQLGSDLNGVDGEYRSTQSRYQPPSY